MNTLLFLISAASAVEIVRIVEDQFEQLVPSTRQNDDQLIEYLDKTMLPALLDSNSNLATDESLQRVVDLTDQVLTTAEDIVERTNQTVQAIDRVNEAVGKVEDVLRFLDLLCPAANVIDSKLSGVFDANVLINGALQEVTYQITELDPVVHCARDCSVCAGAAGAYYSGKRTVAVTDPDGQIFLYQAENDQLICPGVDFKYCPLNGPFANTITDDCSCGVDVDGFCRFDLSDKEFTFATIDEIARAYELAGFAR